MTLFELVDGDNLDYDAFAALQREAYTDLLKSLKVSNYFMSPKFYEWKFHPSLGPAKIVFVREDGHIVSTNAMIPLEINFGKNTIRGWQATDAATLISARGKGYSSGCLRTLFESLKTNEVLFLFPNESSVGYVKAMGSKNKGIVTTWVKPNILIKKRVSQKVIKISRFEKDQDLFAKHLANYDKVFLLRSADYLNWRYINHPVFRYVSFVYKDGNNIQGFCVVRKAKVIGRNITIVMELWGLTSSVKKILLNSVAEWSIENRLKWIVLLDNNQSILKGLNLGFIRVPIMFLPKKQVLMVFAKKGELSQKVIDNDWWIQMGDWDGF